MTDNNSMALVEESGVGSYPASGNAVTIGQWFWLIDQAENKCSVQDMTLDQTQDMGPDSKDKGILMCIVHVGSNYLQLRNPLISDSHNQSYTRVHFRDFWARLIHEPHPEAVLARKEQECRARVGAIMQKIQALTRQLGLRSQEKLAHDNGHDRETGGSDAGRSLMAISSVDNVQQYQEDLRHAHDKTLPDLFKSMKQEHATLAMWSAASAIPLQATASQMESALGEIKDRLLSLGIYAGLVEDMVRVRDGVPAAMHEKLRVMQRRLYMDEECLLNYRHGGMEFQHLDQFDAWLAEQANFERILPFDRCMVAMQVRRFHENMDRYSGAARLDDFIRLSFLDDSAANKTTVLYIRNGQQLYRLMSSDLEFGEKLFPGRHEHDPSRRTMHLLSHQGASVRIKDSMPLESWIDLKESFERERSLHQQWMQEHPGEDAWGSPHYRWDRRDGYYYHDLIRNEHWGGWHEFSPDNVYFDDIAASLKNQMDEYNRIAVLIQGVFDRSLALHPHPPAQTWHPAGFAAAIELIYDADDVLEHGKAPDIQAYIESCNASLDADSITIGQEKAWMMHEAEIEGRRRNQDRRLSCEERSQIVRYYRPYGNPGPGYLARISSWQPRARKAVFTWERQRLHYSSRQPNGIRCGITVPAHDLFNVSVYQPGDYLQFFQDWRTRKDYMHWAPMLLEAEEYHAGRRKAQEPLPNKKQPPHKNQGEIT